MCVCLRARARENKAHKKAAHALFTCAAKNIYNFFSVLYYSISLNLYTYLFACAFISST